MLQYLKQEANKTLTENGAQTNISTLSDCLDLFATVGALRRASDEEIRDRFIRAYAEDKDIAMKLLFYARDVRGGLGERRVFRKILKWLAENHPESVRKNLSFIAEYGRFDDLMVLFDTPLEREMLELIDSQLEADFDAMMQGEEISLLAKWLPSVNATCRATVARANRICTFLGMNGREYRKLLSRLRSHIRIIENNLRERDYTFDYEKQPSKAMFKYRKAFARNDGERYAEFLNRVTCGEAKLNTGTLMPYEIIDPIFKRNVDAAEADAINTTWYAQEDFGTNENALVVVDGSGSMYGGDPRPISVAMSLGIYVAERNSGLFKNHFITFSEKPRLVEIKGDTILEKVRYCHTFNEVANTNVEKVFKLILDAAVKNALPQEELPARIYIISDMEFDWCAEDASLTNFECAKKLFEEAGYRLPEVVFWNVASRNRQQPVTRNEQGVILVSGCTPRLFAMVAENGVDSMTPYEFMLDTLGAERYEKIVA